MYGETKIGTTHGLAGTIDNTNGPRRPEQVYVYETKDPGRPIAIEGWVGYNIDQRLELTWMQAKELLPLLVEAVTR
jgi:hypothetical protein